MASFENVLPIQVDCYYIEQSSWGTIILTHNDVMEIILAQDLLLRSLHTFKCVFLRAKTLKTRLIRAFSEFCFISSRSALSPLHHKGTQRKERPYPVTKAICFNSSGQCVINKWLLARKSNRKLLLGHLHRWTDPRDIIAIPWSNPLACERDAHNKCKNQYLEVGSLAERELCAVSRNICIHHISQ